MCGQACVLIHRWLPVGMQRLTACSAGGAVRLAGAIGLAPKQLGVAAKRFQASSTTPGSPFMPRSNVATLSQ